ncbi:Lethal(2)neighbour of Tid protein [Seminavis robusta]|uniref:dolichyl-P-Man:Man5GlcNAc2-PP-dolichol alpha-1,3-mannosyltransferase n=1 Tax=Seminavis robusta TaxID=568900 RepID=A0A9N8E0Y1_9STRA|nr:Lethal(2)neighbour of Tid protein [Seminavis robusta]|eukprot:Sro509_g157080.1 Lethal(2)neighbour of Tid protein (466) ;mRNA; r:39659-41170
MSSLLLLLPKPLEDWYIRLASSQPWDSLFIMGLVSAEVLLGLVIIDKVPYTEIDWEAYMQEVSMWWDDGIYDYRQIRGGTGPLVYPAGFLYLFAILRWITQQGTNIRLAQYIFLAFYLILQTLVLLIYTKAARSLLVTRKHPNGSNDSTTTTTTRQAQLQSAHSMWSWRIAMGLCCCSKRFHSIFMLRLFNEGPTMVLLYCCLYFLIHNHWNSACLAFSYAVSIKMNVLLFAPGLLLLLIQQARGNLVLVVKRLLVCCALPQLVLGAPFLLTYPESYLRKAFELDRVFFFKWTVNWKFLPEDIFVSKPLAMALLAGHLGTLAFFAVQWVQAANNNNKTQQTPPNSSTTRLSPHYICYTMFVANFVGIAFARTIHYQFYAWYFSSVPFLLWSGTGSGFFHYPMPIRILLVVGLEYAFLTFPATPTSSKVLQLVHLAILLQIRPPKQMWERQQQHAIADGGAKEKRT